MEDADATTITSLANLIDDEVFGIQLSTGTLQSRDPEFKKARTGKQAGCSLSTAPAAVMAGS